MNEETVIYKIYEDLIQSACEANHGRELTETELKRLPCLFMENEHFYSTMYGLMVEMAEEAMKDEEWKDWDERYKDTPLEEIIK